MDSLCIVVAFQAKYWYILRAQLSGIKGDSSRVQERELTPWIFLYHIDHWKDKI